MAALLAAAVVAASVSSHSADAPVLAFQSGDAPAVSLDCDGVVLLEGEQIFCLLEGYSGAAPSASLSVSSPGATATYRAISPIRTGPFVAAEGTPGFVEGGWYIGFTSLNDLSCNAPTTAVLTVTAGGDTYSASIELISDEYQVPIDGWWVRCYPAETPSVSVADATASESDSNVTFVISISPPSPEPRAPRDWPSPKR